MFKMKPKGKMIFRRIIALTIVITMSLGILPMPEISEDVRKVLFQDSTNLIVHAVSNPTISNYTQLKDYVDNYTASNKSDNITIQCTEKLSIPYDFPGIGTSEAPFEGKVIIMNISNDDGGASKYLQLQAPLFNYISDKATIVNASSQSSTLYLYPDAMSSDVNGGIFDKPLFASHVSGTGGTANWKIKVNDYDYGVNPPTLQINARSSIIGELVNKTAAPNVTIDYYNQNAAVNGADDLGVICNKISSGSLTVNLSNGLETGNISTTGGNVGGLVGSMATGTTLNINSSINYANKRTITTSSGYAGGIVGKCEGIVTFSGANTYNDSRYSDIIGTTGAGGLFGYFDAEDNVTFSLDKYTITSRPGDSVDPGQGIKSDIEYGKTGGLIGELVNSGTGSTITISGSSGAVNAATPSVDVTLYGKYGGGLIGYYSADSINDSLVINNVYCKSEGSMADIFGGIIGEVASTNDCGSGIKISNAKTESTAYPANSNIDYKRKNTISAGFIANTKNSFIDISETVKINAGTINSGLIYTSDGGVVRFSGVTDISTLTAGDKLSALLVVNRDNTLIYALGSGTDYDSSNGTGWNYIRPSSDKTLDDIKSWGQVVRYVNTSTSGTNDMNLQVAGVVSVSGNVVTLADADTSMTTSADFAKTALNIKLNTSDSDFGALKFTSGSSNQSATLLNTAMSLEADIDLFGSGLTGLTKDNGSNNSYSSTFDGKNHTIKLATGEAYGYISNTSTSASIANGSAYPMTGAIQGHNYNGLFAKFGGSTVKDLIIDGFINSSGTSIGGLAAVINGATVNLSNVDTAYTSLSSQFIINSFGGTNVGFLVGNIPDGSPSALNISNSDIKGKVYSRKAGSKIGTIGTVTDKNITITTDEILLAASIDYSAAGGASIGGFVGETSGGTSRLFNLNGIVVDGMSVTTNNTSGGINSPAGALIGGIWHDTNVIFKDSTHSDGVTVTDGALTLTGTNNTYAGGLVGEATGYWQVNNVELTGMTISGATDALGLLVMRGIIIDSNNVHKGLYLEITSPTAYSISASGLSLPGSVGVFDEIMAYSKLVVSTDSGYVPSEANGQAIISIHTSEIGGTPKLSMSSTDNSYQPRTTLGANYNPFSRYYYNLDYLLTNASTGGEKLLLWSVNQYAASNISSNAKVKSERTKGFSDYSSFPSETALDLSYLSYYPVNVTGELSVAGKTVTFNNSAMQSAHGGTYSLNSLDASDRISQHYLMHAGLFKDVSSNLTVSNMTLKGNVSAHVAYGSVEAGSGAIVCGSVVGSAPNAKAALTINGLSLDGISVNGSTGIDALIVKKIGNNTNISISNVSTTGQYVNDATVNAAKYLMGDAQGTAMTILFDKMVLDGRTTSSSLYNPSATSGTTAYDLNQTYNTYQSIFSNATFLRSLNYVIGSGSSAKYDYKWEEDWGSTTHQVTYGKEISDTIENRDEGVSKQSKYVDRYNDIYTSPESNALAVSPYDFSAFRPHVSVGYNSTTNYHEVAVNIVSDVLDKGCGTYNDPYIVNGAQLKVIADILSDTGSNTGISNGFYLNIDNDYLAATDKYNFVRNCENKSGHTKFTYTSGTSLSGKLNGVNKTLQVQYVKDYLAGAYYYIESPTILPSDYSGLGGALNRFAFRGVIVGADGVTIENQSPFPLIKISNGSVVKNLTINVTNASIEKSAGTKNAFGYSTTTEYYGAVIGEIMAGDNVIDNVKVHFSSPITVSGDYKMNVPVGGYIGVVVNGSVFFRNMGSINASNNTVGTDTGMNFHVTDGTNSDIQNEVTIDPATGAETFYSLYVNPIIGRVINGFAVNETRTASSTGAYRFSEDGKYVDWTSTNGRTRGTTSDKVTLKNNRKNYSIPDFNSTSKLIFSASDGTYDTITANDAQALYILSLICQANMGSAANDDPSIDAGKYTTTLGYDSTASNSTRYRATHLADYDGVGKLTLNPVTNPGLAPTQNEGESDEDFAERHSAWEEAYTAYTSWQTALTSWNSTYTSDFNKTKDEKVHNTQQVPYLIYAYTNSYTNGSNHTCYPARTVINSGRTWDLNLKTVAEGGTANIYYLPDSFRGIGSIANTAYCPIIKNLNGKTNIIDTNMYVRTYATTYDNHSTISGGIGLFNCLKQDGATVTNGKPGSGSNTIGSFTLSGYISGKRTNGAWTAVQMAATAKDIKVGGLAPVNSTVYNISSIQFNNLNIDGSGYVGSLFASVATNPLCVNNCNADKLKVTGFGPVGGLVGELDKSLYFNTIENAESHFKINVHQLNAGNSSCYTGGFVGYIKKTNGNLLLIKNANVIGWNGEFGSSNAKAYIGRAPDETLSDNTLYVGGVLGYNVDDGKPVNNANVIITTVFDNIHIYGVNIYGNVVGGIIGRDGDNKTKQSITNCGIHGKSTASISIDDSSSYEIKANSVAGGIIGRAYNEFGSDAYSESEKTAESFSFDSSFTYIKQLNGCSVNDYRIEESSASNFDNALSSGGIIGVSRNNKSIKNISVKNCTIISNGELNGSAYGMGGIIGAISKHIINAYNVVIDNVDFEIISNGVNKMPYGLFCGYALTNTNDNDTVVKLVGYTTLGSNTISSAFGDSKKTYINAGERDVEFDCGRLPSATNFKENKFNNRAFRYGTNSYIIYSDYEGACELNNSTVGSRGTILSTVNGNNNAPSVSAIDNYPYANSSPAVSVADKILSGDGIWHKNDNGTISLKADKILADCNTWESTCIAKKYSNITSADITNYEALKSKISTFNLQYGSDILENDIPVIVLDNQSDYIEDTNRICSYIRILTNSTKTFLEDNDSVYSMDMLKCTITGSGSSATMTVTSSDASLERLNSGYIKMKDPYDSAADGPQFTVIDVQFKNPADTSKIAYHLYIPVFTQKAFNFKFDITALSGTSYYRNEYSGGSHFSGLPSTRNNDESNIVVENYSTPVTMFMRYEYSVNDIIKDLLAGGYGLNWNYNKALDFYYNYSNDDSLPAGTKFVLIDVNNKDKANYSSGFSPGANADLDINSTVFPSYTVDGTNYSAFSVVTFKELLYANGITFIATPLADSAAITAAQDSGTPIFHEETTIANDGSQFTATGVSEGKSLVPADADEISAGSGLYTVTASSNYPIYEDYYLTIIAPADSGDIRHQINVKSKVTLDHDSKIKANCEANDNVILMFANLFTKDISIKTIENDETDKEMNTNVKNSIDIQAITTISFNGAGLGDQLDEVRRALNDRDISIYHSTLLDFVKLEADNTTQTVAVDGVSFALNSVPDGSEHNYKYNSGVYVKVANGTTGEDIFYSDDTATEDRYKRVVSCTDSSDFSGSPITTFYEVINKDNGNKIDIRPYITGEYLSDESAHEVKIVANFSMTFNSNGINDQFAVRESGSNAGTIIKGQAALAYLPDDTTYSNNTSELVDSSPYRKYYRQPASKTELYYNTLNTENLATADAKTKTNAMLGINPFDEGTTTRSEINTWGNYDASQLTGASTANNVKWTISLYRREKVGAGAEYGTALNINDYLTDIKFYGYDAENAEKGQLISQATSTLTELVYQSSRSSFEDVTPNRFIAYIDYKVKTGADLESESQFYSNYKVLLTAELVGDTNSRASDHIIYTNARLDPSFIDKVITSNP